MDVFSVTATVELAGHCSPSSAHRSHEMLGTRAGTTPAGKGSRSGPCILKRCVKKPSKLSLTFTIPLPCPVSTQSTPLQEDSPYIYLYSCIDSDRWHQHHQQQKQCAEKPSLLFVQGKILEPTRGDN